MEISFILVEPTVPENIGASARAIKTMGFNKLCLVQPVVYRKGKAKIVAHASGEILDNAKTYNSFDEVVGDFDFLVGCSAKKRRTNEEYLVVNELSDFLQSKGDLINKIGIVFGREESGLDNEEIKKCDIVSYVPMVSPYPSLNLSQAVMIFAHHLSKIKEHVKIEETSAVDVTSLGALKKKARKVIELINLKQSHIIGPRILERMSYLKKDDVNLLHSICSAILDREK